VVAVKEPAARGRSQRKSILQLPEAMLEKQRVLFPDEFDRDGIIATFALRAIAQRINDRTNELLAPLGLNAAKYNYLVVIYFSAEQMLTLNEISVLIHTSNATVTSMVKTLESDGLLRREANPTDGRSVVVELTPAGRRTIERAIPAHRHDIAVGMRAFSAAERAQLAALLLKLGRGLDADTDGEDGT